MVSGGPAVETIYMPLENEGTDCWRPVRAERLSDELFKVLGEQPDDEEWRFPPLAVVRVELKTFQGGVEGLQIVALAD